jgi:hypothetical protein
MAGPAFPDDLVDASVVETGALGAAATDQAEGFDGGDSYG